MMVPKRLKEARKRAGLSQEGLLQLADMETVSNKSQVSSYESGRYSPPFEFIMQIAKTLDYPEAYFYTPDDAFAESILELHRNKNNPEFNPYLTELKMVKQQLKDAQKMASSLNDFLKSK